MFIFKHTNQFLMIENFLPLRDGVAPYLNKHESPSPNIALCLGLIKLPQWFGEVDENVKSLQDH